MPEGMTNVAGQRLDLPEPEISQSGATMGGSAYKILGTLMPVLVMNVKPGQTVYTETGALSWMSDGIQMQTNLGGQGLGGLVKRALGGESLFVANFTAARDNTLLAFSSEFPGKIIPVNLAQGQSMIAQKESFLVAEKTVNLTIAFQKKLGSGFFGGEGLFFARLVGPGRVWLQTMPMSKLAGAIKQFFPQAQGQHESPGLNIKLG